MKILILLFTLFSFLNAETQNPKEQVKQLTEKYFQVWSDGKIDEYGKLFDPKAAIFFRDSFTKQIISEDLKTFLKGQEAVQSNKNNLMKEVPLKIQIELTGEETAMVTVYWKLISSQIIFGYDHFIWAKTNAGWKIVSLFFYNTK